MIIKEMHPINTALNIGLDADGCMQIRAEVSRPHGPSWSGPAGVL